MSPPYYVFDNLSVLSIYIELLEVTLNPTIILHIFDIFQPPGNRKEPTKEQQTKSSAGHQPFLQLVLTCLRELDNSGADSKKQDREEQKENLLNSLHTQMSTYLFFKDKPTGIEQNLIVIRGEELYTVFP